MRFDCGKYDIIFDYFMEITINDDKNKLISIRKYVEDINSQYIIIKKQFNYSLLVKS